MFLSQPSLGCHCLKTVRWASRAVHVPSRHDEEEERVHGRVPYWVQQGGSTGRLYGMPGTLDGIPPGHPSLLHVSELANSETGREGQGFLEEPVL